MAHASGTAVASVSDIAVDCAPGPYAELLDIAGPVDGLSPAQGKVFYGTAESTSATTSQGILYRLSTNGMMSLVHRFQGGSADGAQPTSAPTMSGNGALPLYGTTMLGGTQDRGTVYEVYANLSFRVLHSFNDGSDGCYPESRLIVTGNGTIYGVSASCGDYGEGTLFSITSGGVFQVLHSFGAGASGLSDVGPDAPILASNGEIYGTGTYGGVSGCGGMYEYDPSNHSYAVLFSFAQQPDGIAPHGGLVQVGADELYGVTSGGGTNNDGTLYRVNLQTGAHQTIYSFQGGALGWEPTGTPYLGSDGNLYLVATDAGAIPGPGEVLSVSTSGVLQRVVHTFSLSTGFSTPNSRLVAGPDGYLYGSARWGEGGDAGGIYVLY